MHGIDLYLAKTPRHWWLAHAIAAAEARPAVLMVTEGFHGAEQLIELSKSIKNSPFLTVELIPGKRSSHRYGFFKRRFYKHFEWSIQKQAIDRILAKYDVSRFITANLTALPTQYIYHRYQQTDCQFWVLDDGLVQYRPEIIQQKTHLDEQYQSLLKGFKVRFPKQDQILPFFSHGWFFAPALLHHRLKHLHANKIELHYFDKPVMTELSNRLFKTMSLNSQKWQQSKVVFVFSNESYLQTDCEGFTRAKFEQAIQDFINKNNLQDHAVWVKYHPREHEEDVFGLKKHYPNCEFIPSQIPFEVIVTSLKPADYVVGELSTVLFDVALNRPDVSVHSLMCVTKQKPEYELFNKAGVCLHRVGQ
ncbi:hypothetical protein THIAE_04180 [Thiomicrospira aerophila AL3]|uniref:Uncharacterized protein n=1 Tax=Thiomicrospira aerophila AL3 TaxID=717772 RepID=W0DZ19_9GAMM|nr:polysialyltransferase family glycosyltransferase [Thiomicrospira aerophila]AHF02219.1 hypothetical protein THIAE_04180 [Thiomicrospira aerophila AL3]